MAIINGTTNKDVLIGTHNADSISGDDGDDTLFGRDGHDTVFGGFGNDILWGNDGNDVMRGEDGNDKLFGGDGNDNLDGGLGDDLLVGGDGNDILHGRQGTDILLGGAGDDRLTGVSGTDDILNGGTGNDTAAIKVGTSGDGDGSYANLLLGYATTGPAHTNHITLISIENLEGDTGVDTLIGNHGANVLVGSGGIDTLTGNGGADTFLYAPDANFGGDLGGGDIITDFVHGLDRIDVSAIDAVAGPGNQMFAWGGMSPTANGIWYTDNGLNTTIEADVNGDTTADFQITLLGTGLGLAASDFAL